MFTIYFLLSHSGRCERHDNRDLWVFILNPSQRSWAIPGNRHLRNVGCKTIKRKEPILLVEVLPRMVFPPRHIESWPCASCIPTSLGLWPSSVHFPPSSSHSNNAGIQSSWIPTEVYHPLICFFTCVQLNLPFPLLSPESASHPGCAWMLESSATPQPFQGHCMAHRGPSKSIWTIERGKTPECIWMHLNQ